MRIGKKKRKEMVMRMSLKNASLARSERSPDDGSRPPSMFHNTLPRTHSRVQWGFSSSKKPSTTTLVSVEIPYKSS